MGSREASFPTEMFTGKLRHLDAKVSFRTSTTMVDSKNLTATGLGDKQTEGCTMQTDEKCGWTGAASLVPGGQC